MALEPSHPRVLLDNALVALTLAGICRLRQDFFSEASAATRSILLSAAAELMDRTVCNKELRAMLVQQAQREGAAANPVALLVANRAGVAVVPPQLWPAARTHLNDLGQANYRGWRALTQALRQESTDLDRTMGALQAWLAPVWVEYPGLKAEALALPVALQALQAAG